MAVSLTQGAITEICRGNCSENLQPVLQVIELKQVQSQQNSTVERYCVVLSDGSFYQQGMLATQKNDLVHSGKLQKGSVLRLTQFLCNVVQNHKIIIIIDLDVILDYCELIGQPVSTPKHTPKEPGVNFGNSQSLNSSSHAGGMNARPNVSGSSIYYPKANPPARNDPPAYPKAKTLTQGAIMEICSGNDPKNLQPVLQVIEFKLVQSQQNSTIERYRVVLSDGSFYQQGMLATQKNELIYSGRLQQGAIIRLTQFICNVVQNRKIIIIVDLDVICEKCELIGEPVAAPKGAPAESATGQSGFTFGNLQYLDRSSHSGGMTTIQNLAGQSLDLKPVLQVLELELVNSQQHSASVNFHLVLSDGYHFQQAMLTTQKNQLVRSGKLQKGSIVRLTQFVCNVVQSCKIIMVLDLDVVLEKCELLGQPVAAPAEFATGQPSGFTFGNSQSLNSCSHAGGVSGLANDFSAMNLATGQVLLVHICHAPIVEALAIALFFAQILEIYLWDQVVVLLSNAVNAINLITGGRDCPDFSAAPSSYIWRN
ncbi:hypothetical protein AAZX31_09G194800 [Glycine max]